MASTMSSYIPTNGSAATRAAETLTIPSANLPWPTPRVIGEELVTNGTFDTDTDWTKGTGWTIGSGVASFVPGSGNLTQSVGITAGNVYEITFTLSDTQAGTFLGVRLGGATNLATYSGVSDGVKTVQVVAENTDTILKFAPGVGGNVSIDNISVREIKPLAVSIQMEGTMTYADTAASSEIRFVRWLADSNNYIIYDYATDGAYDRMKFEQRSSGTIDNVQNTSAPYSPGINVPFNIASRHGSTFINGAVDGTALTENTTPVALPDLSSTDMEIGYDFMGTIKTLRIWADDIGDTGIAEAST